MIKQTLKQRVQEINCDMQSWTALEKNTEDDLIEKLVLLINDLWKENEKLFKCPTRYAEGVEKLSVNYSDNIS